MVDWKTISSKVVYKNPRFSIREDKLIRPDGKNGVYYVMDRPSAVIVVPLTKDNEIYLIRISRYTTKKTHWELPAGSSDNEDELLAAKRELEEETGMTSKSWTKLGELEVAPGMTGQLAHVFVANEVVEAKKRCQKEEYIDRLKKASFQKVLLMIRNNEIVDSPVVAAILLAGLKLKLFN